MKVHLRQRRQTKQGRISLYLELYKGTTQTPEGRVKGSRDYKYLDLFLIDKPRTPIDKQHNKNTLKLAESIKAKTELEIKNGIHGFASDFKNKTNFIDYFKKQTEKRLKNNGTYGHWDSVLKQLIKFAGTQVTFREVDKIFCERFKEYLMNEAITKSGNKLSSNSIASYFIKLRACLNKAVEEDIILKNPANKISVPKVVENKREFLTLDELKAIAKVEFRYDFLKRAFLFSCLSGLRWSDVKKLKWSEVQQYNYKDKEGKGKNGWRITFNQQKTKGLQYLDISEQARKYLGEAGKPDESIFKELVYNSYYNMALQLLMKQAGITKPITFHCARHTNAVLLLSNGADLYTVQKRLGHSQISTTQIYAKIIDEKQREAANLIPDLTI